MGHCLCSDTIRAFCLSLSQTPRRWYGGSRSRSSRSALTKSATLKESYVVKCWAGRGMRVVRNSVGRGLRERGPGTTPCSAELKGMRAQRAWPRRTWAVARRRQSFCRGLFGAVVHRRFARMEKNPEIPVFSRPRAA